MMYREQQRQLSVEVVLILVVVEYALCENMAKLIAPNGGLNPCCCGVCSMCATDLWEFSAKYVLILVVVEYALCDLITVINSGGVTVLILVVVEYALCESLLDLL